MSGRPGLTGIVLAGGHSSRMGRDKATLPWGDSDLLHTVLGRLAPACRELIVVSNIPRRLTMPAVRVVPDQYIDCGPLGGIQAGLAAAASEYSFVAACDMPFVNAASVEFLWRAAAGYDAAVPYIDGYYHPLCAVYHRRCLASVEALLQTGRYRVIDFYPDVRLRAVTREELTTLDQNLRLLRNLNGPDDLMALQ